MNPVPVEERLREELRLLHDGLTPRPVDAGADVRRGRRALRRRVVGRAAAAGGGLVLAGALAVAATGGTLTARPLPVPAGGPTSSTPHATSAPVATPVPVRTTTVAPLTTSGLGRRMLEAVRRHTAGAWRYLGGWGDGTGGTGMASGPAGVTQVRVRMTWSEPGSKARGGIEVWSSSARFAQDDGPGDRTRCAGVWAEERPATCRVVATRADGATLWYGSRGGTRAASITYPDGRTVAVSATSLQAGNSLRATSAPLPTRSELLAVVVEPSLTWRGRLVDDVFDRPPYGPEPVRP